VTSWAHSRQFLAAGIKTPQILRASPRELPIAEAVTAHVSNNASPELQSGRLAPSLSSKTGNSHKIRTIQ
jgi:hypothetical protein